MKRKLSAAVFFAAVTVLTFATSAGAVDGTIEINQAKVLAGGGFPYKITTGGSYRLAGNLTPPANIDAIDVTPPNVTIDLNGFSIVGTGSSDIGYGIYAPNSGVTVENGTVTAFAVGVQVGYNSIVRNVHADSNGTGIFTTNNSVIEGCTANSDTSYGIYCSGSGCVISGNTTNENISTGISCSGTGCAISGNTAISNWTGIYCGGYGCLISSNTLEDNSHYGIVANDTTTGYGGNVLNGNGTNLVGGTSMGAKNTNLCSGTAC